MSSSLHITTMSSCFWHSENEDAVINALQDENIIYALMTLNQN